MRVLGIETSCDETGVALYEAGVGIRAERLASQIPIHAAYGGVVPELASRDHIAKLLPMVETVLEDAQIELGGLDAIAYTAGPGLIGALIFYVQQADGFWSGVLGILKAIVWPAFVVYDLLKFLTG